jgi:anti-anti-sigma regulatory factor
MESSPLVILDLSAVEDIDLSCLQVLYAARRGARESGRQFDLTGRLRPRLVSRLRSTGFISTEVETGEELEQALSFFKGAET